MKESQIQKAILDYLAARRVFSVRLNSGAVKLEGRFLRFSTPGCADIIACPKGRPATWLEIKSEDGRQSPAQRSFQESVEAAGHIYRICRSIEDVEEALR